MGKQNIENTDTFFAQANELKELLGDICNLTLVAEERLERCFGKACFLDVDDVMKITNYSRPTVLAMFNRKDFPCSDLGKKKLVLNWAFYSYFMHPVRAEEAEYENY